MSGEPGFLARWSRRKRAVLHEAEAPQAPDVAAPPAPEIAAPPAAEAPRPAEPLPATELPAFDPASLPALECLTAESDITGFLRAGVPAALRQAALRRIWSLDPLIRDYVGPADYAWDFNAPDGVPGFSLELGGDVRKLLAQAIGLPEEGEAPAEVPSALPTESPSTLPAEAPSMPADLAAVPASSPPGVAADPVLRSPALPGGRRHGGAIPG